MVKHHKCFWKSVSNMNDKTWERVKFILKFSMWLLIICLILVLIFLAPEQLENFGKGLSLILPFTV